MKIIVEKELGELWASAEQWKESGDAQIIEIIYEDLPEFVDGAKRKGLNLSDKMRKCESCGGSGKVQKPTLLGKVHKCRLCKGTGRKPFKARCNYNKTGCQKEAAPGRKRCPEHLEMLRFWTKTGRERRKALGLCSLCEEQVFPGSFLCIRHRNHSAELRKLAWKPRFHQCQMCKKMITGKSNHCPGCQPKAKAIAYAKNLKSIRRLQQARKREGLCIRGRCPEEAEAGRTRCRKHLDYSAAKMRLRNRRPRFCCCGKELPYHRRLCDACKNERRRIYIAARIKKTAQKLERLKREPSALGRREH